MKTRFKIKKIWFKIESESKFIFSNSNFQNQIEKIWKNFQKKCFGGVPRGGLWKTHFTLFPALRLLYCFITSPLYHTKGCQNCLTIYEYSPSAYFPDSTNCPQNSTIFRKIRIVYNFLKILNCRTILKIRTNYL